MTEAPDTKTPFPIPAPPAAADEPAVSMDDDFGDEPTRVAPPEYDALAAQAFGRQLAHADAVAREAAAAKADGFDQEDTRVGLVPDLENSSGEAPRMASTDQPPEFEAEEETSKIEAAEVDTARQGTKPGLNPEELYRSQVKAEISFSRSTGYDKESTAVVPLAELARREEERLRETRRPARPGEAQDLSGGEHVRALPMGEILDVLRAARTVEEVAGVLVEIVANLLPRVLLLWQRHDRLVGFASRGMNLTQVKLMTLEMPLEVLQEMTAAPLDLESFVGPPRLTGMAPKLFELLGFPPKEILIIPGAVTYEDRWMLYADNGPKPLPRLELRLLEVIVSRAGARADLLLDRSLLW
ncbi:MAG: hypothetical protein JRF33_10710 [Deltaproteobacteria bacterium]|nr:hypothetical protein [Deltaproteobacteria bacterium]